MNKISYIFLLLILMNFTFAESYRTLHLSAHPTGTDVYVSKSNPDFSIAPDFTTPANMILDKETDTVRVTLFSPGFKDSTLKISIPKINDSYLMVILQEESRDEILKAQEHAINKRRKRTASNWVLLSSLIPYGAGIFTWIMNIQANEDAKNTKETLTKHKIETSRTLQLKNDLKEYRKDAKNYRNATYWCIGSGSFLAAIGIYLRF